jgi:acyl-CoA synthetase (AMP-forming)/AMP-acid ligase II
MLHDSLDQWAARQPEALWAADATRSVTFGEAQSATRHLAASIQRAGVAAGERVAVLARNRLEFVLLYYAASRAGVTLVPLNTRLAAEEWAFILGDADPRVLFVDPSFVESLPDTRAEMVVFDAGFDTWLQGEDARSDFPGDEDRDLLQLYTSATTGRPKGAVLTQRAVCANIAQIGEAIQTPPGERSLVVAPLFHAGVVPSTLTPLARGGSAYLQAEFRPAEAVDALERERIGYAVLVPAMLQACLSDVALQHSRSSGALRLIYYGSSPIAESTLRAAIEAFSCEFVQSYGMTEATQSVSFLTHADHLRGLRDRPDLLLSAGRAAAGTELDVVDAEDRPLPAGQSGEVVVRGPQVMRSYWNQPEATADTLRNGWLHTGDVGTLDDEGFLTIRDRVKDMVVSGGENVYPRAVEDALMRHPMVADVAVIGVPDARWGEAVKAIVVARSGTTPTAEALIAHCREHVGGFEVPRSVDFVSELPRNATGKVLKRVLREPYWADRERQISGG